MLLLWVNTNGEDDVCISFGCFCTIGAVAMRSAAACVVALNAIASDADIAVDAVACKC